MTASDFEQFAREVLGRRFGVPLRKAKRPGFPKEFDLVSDDGQIVGDAKFYTMVSGTRNPPAKWSIIAEHVWFLEKVRAENKFLIFGNDPRVASKWLERWGGFVDPSIRFFFLGPDGTIETLK